MQEKFVYQFQEGNKYMIDLLGVKGANLCEIKNQGFPTPNGFIISSAVYANYVHFSAPLPSNIIAEIMRNLTVLQQQTGKEYGIAKNPLLVSIRSGSRVSMPGAMDTILNVGINNSIAASLATKTKNIFFAYGIYQKFIQDYATIVKKHPLFIYEKIVEEFKAKYSITEEKLFTESQFKELIDALKRQYQKIEGTDFPEDPKEQFFSCIYAIFKSWENPRAEEYRRKKQISHDFGSSVTVQEMVFGNINSASGSGVLFTRNPSNGKDEMVGDFLYGAQGEDVVNGRQHPLPFQCLQKNTPAIYQELLKIGKQLETYYKDMQDIEFTVENGKLYLLQTRSGKRTTNAALQIAISLVEEKLIQKDEALLLFDASQLKETLPSQFNEKALQNSLLLAKGNGSSPGAISGPIVFSVEDSKKYPNSILLCNELISQDIPILFKAKGILSAQGGVASHSALLARSFGIPCVVGVKDLRIDKEHKSCTINAQTFYEGDILSLDGTTGNIYAEKIQLADEKICQNHKIFMRWVDEFRQMKIFINANTPSEIERGLALGAEGIGLCRTEHMFFEQKRLEAIQKLIISVDASSREIALQEIFPYQLSDFTALYETAEYAPIVIRLLDPFLQEFLPSKQQDIEKAAESLGISVSYLTRVVESLAEINPLIKSGGVRLAVFYPEIIEMQTAAIIQAALDVRKKTGKNIIPRILIPQTAELKEVVYIKKHIQKVADALISQTNDTMRYSVGCTVGVPRACVLIEELAQVIDFFIFDTNNLTQMLFGFSDDEAGDLMDIYYHNRIFSKNPFISLDQKGVGHVLQKTLQRAQTTNNALRIGVIGQHCQDVTSIEFFHDIDMNYVSCSPTSVPMAKLAAAQAAIQNPK